MAAAYFPFYLGGQNVVLQFWVFLIIMNTRLALLSESLSHPFRTSRRCSHTQGQLFSVSNFPVGKRNVYPADYFTFPPLCQGKPPRPANSFPARLAALGSRRVKLSSFVLHGLCGPKGHSSPGGVDQPTAGRVLQCSGSSEDRKNPAIGGSWRLASPILPVIPSSPGITQVPAPRVICFFLLVMHHIGLWVFLMDSQLLFCSQADSFYRAVRGPCSSVGDPFRALTGLQRMLSLAEKWLSPD